MSKIQEVIVGQFEVPEVRNVVWQGLVSPPCWQRHVRVHMWGTMPGSAARAALVSGPISVLLFAQYGSRFAVHAAYGTMLGFVAAGAFCSSYAAVSSKRSWWQALTVAYVAFFVTAAVLSLVHVDFAWLAVLVLVALTSIAFTIDAPARSPIGR